MKPFSVVRSLPQPLKCLYVLWILGVLVAVIVIMTSPKRAGLAMGPFAIVVILTGLTLLTNFRGGAEAMAQAMKTRRPWGIDYSRSFLATTTYGESSALSLSSWGVDSYTRLSRLAEVSAARPLVFAAFEIVAISGRDS